MNRRRFWFYGVAKNRPQSLLKTPSGSISFNSWLRCYRIVECVQQFIHLTDSHTTSYCIDETMLYYNRNFYVREISDTDLWSQCRWCCYWQVPASRQPTLWTCSWIRASNRPLWFRSLQLTKILSGRQDDSLSPTLPVPIWTSEIESLSSRTHTVRRFVRLCTHRRSVFK